jgi:Sec-independent protein secretion pathway component TatC
MHNSPHYRPQQIRIGRRARERATRRYRVPALVLFCVGVMVSYFGHGPAAVTLAVLLGCAAVFLSNIDVNLRK